MCGMGLVITWWIARKLTGGSESVDSCCMGKMIACNNSGVDRELAALGDGSVEQKLSIVCQL